MHKPARLIGVAATCLCAMAPALGQARNRSAELVREIASTRKAGLPVTPSDLRWRVPATAGNAAPLYEQAWALRARIPEQEALPIGELGRGMPTGAQLAPIRRVLEGHRNVTALFERAAAKPVCAFLRDWAKGPGLLFPEYARFRDTARWLSAAAYVQLADGKPAEAVRIQALCFRVASHTATDPTLISWLVGAAIDAITLNGMDRILYVAGRNPAVCDAVGRAVAARSQVSLAHAMPGEVVMGMVAVDETRRGGMEFLRQLAGETKGYKEIARGGNRKPAKWDPLMDANAAYLLRTYRRAYLALARPYPQAEAALRSISAQVEQDGRKHNLAAILASILVPVYAGLPSREAQVRARSACTRAAAAILAWKARHGSFPGRLADALKPAPLDPFSGGSLRYRREGAGFVVYSVGETGRFDGGKPGVKPGPREAIFRYPRPAYLK